jgi:Cu/Ag efflux protein CusF
MNWKTLALASTIALGLGGAAFAEETTGTIQSLDAATHKVVLDDGMTYTFQEAADDDTDWTEELTTFKVGDKVRIIWDTQQDARIATEMSGVHQ